MKLRDEDYIYLYLWATPAQISKEFGKLAHSERQIYRIFKRMGLTSTREERKRLYTKCALDLGELKHFDEIVTSQRQRAFQDVRDRMEKIKQCYAQ